MYQGKCTVAQRGWFVGYNPRNGLHDSTSFFWQGCKRLETLEEGGTVNNQIPCSVNTYTTPSLPVNWMGMNGSIVSNLVLVFILVHLSLCISLPGAWHPPYMQIRNRQPQVAIVKEHLTLAQQLPPLVTPNDVFQLQTIYHHASPSGPIPGLFRKLELSSQDDMLRNDPFMSQDYHVKVQRGAIYRPVSSDYLYDMYQYQQNDDRAIMTWMSTMNHLTFDYYLTQGMLPDVSHKPSVLALAMMARNAYHDKIDDRGDWYDLGAQWNLVSWQHSILGYFVINISFYYVEWILWMGIRWHPRTCLWQ